MKQTIFETRERTQEMLQQAVAIWQQSMFSEQLEELDKDPVFTMLMTALAYQANEMDSELERLKADVLEDYAQLLVPYEVGHAIPATTVVETLPGQNVTEVELDERSVFRLKGLGHSFVPLFKTRVLNAKVQSISRLDGRRWKVSLVFKGPIDNLSGFTFAINDGAFHDLQVTVGGKPLPIIRPWDFSQLPLTTPFGLGAMLYNNLHSYNASASCLDLFTRHNLRMYFFKNHSGDAFYPKEMEKIDLVFEFSGISDNFVFNKSMLALNCVVLVNATIKTAALSPDNPIVRTAGYNNTDNAGGEQFMHLVRPTDEQLYADSPVEVRWCNGDRFNPGSLIRLLNALNSKFRSDYYAFQQQADVFNDNTIQALQKILSRLTDVVQRNEVHSMPGVYLMLRDSKMPRQGSIDIDYLTTMGANINQALTRDSVFEMPTGISGDHTRQIVDPIPGRDQLTDLAATGSLSRYFISTSDRIVTQADVKLFCYNELQTRYGIIRDMVSDITVSPHVLSDRYGCGYEMVVAIQLVGNTYVQRTLAEKIPQVEILLQKMIEVRSTNIYPIRVSIQIINN